MKTNKNEDTKRHWKKDDRPQKGLWAPGDYLGKCECGDYFVGDKLARRCADCAYSEEVAVDKTVSLFPVDRRRLLSIISDIKSKWENSQPMEYSAMEYGIIQFHKWILDELNIKN